MDLGLRGRKALVTGASRGIGKEIATILAQEGADLAICARNEGPLKALADELAGAHGVNVFPRALDVADGDALRGWIADAGRELGGLDIYVNNASASVPQLPPEEAWKASFDADIMAFVRGLEATTPLLAESDAASVVTIGTTAAIEAFQAGPNSFVAAKARLERRDVSPHMVLGFGAGGEFLARRKRCPIAILGCEAECLNCHHPRKFPFVVSSSAPRPSGRVLP
jgi:NAD(P)-dependent dehydrogenase (short-subunit alcohol dehydrogenase family)